MFKIKLSTEEHIVLLEVLISTVEKLDKDNNALRDHLEFYRTQNEELKRKNKKLQYRMNSIYRNADSPTPF